LISYIYKSRHPRVILYHLNQDSQWSETGDRYLLKLFRDFVFHQTKEDGSPLSDWGHVVEALNKVGVRHCSQN